MQSAGSGNNAYETWLIGLFDLFGCWFTCFLYIILVPTSVPYTSLVEQYSEKICNNCAFCDKSTKFGTEVQNDIISKSGYWAIASHASFPEYCLFASLCQLLMQLVTQSLRKIVACLLLDVIMHLQLVLLANQ